MGLEEANAELLKMLSMTDEERDAYFKKLPPDGTSTKLVRDLLLKDKSEERDMLIARAEAYYYDDFRSEYQGACPKVKLVEDLNALGYRDLANKTMAGEYD